MKECCRNEHAVINKNKKDLSFFFYIAYDVKEQSPRSLCKIITNNVIISYGIFQNRIILAYRYNNILEYT